MTKHVNLLTVDNFRDTLLNQINRMNLAANFYGSVDPQKMWDGKIRADQIQVATPLDEWNAYRNYYYIFIPLTFGALEIRYEVEGCAVTNNRILDYDFNVKYVIPPLFPLRPLHANNICRSVNSVRTVTGTMDDEDFDADKFIKVLRNQIISLVNAVNQWWVDSDIVRRIINLLQETTTPLPPFYMHQEMYGIVGRLRLISNMFNMGYPTDPHAKEMVEISKRAMNVMLEFSKNNSVYKYHEAHTV